MDTYVLHYAPDNASLIVRMTLDMLCVPFETRLVDRRTSEQRSAHYLALNPNGLIPTLETPDGPIFETGAILLWLSERHGALAPAPDSPARGDFLKWLFFCANTVHAQLRLLFYADQTVGSDATLKSADEQSAQQALVRHFQTLDIARTNAFGHTQPSVLDIYLAVMLRWCAIYGPDDRSWFRLDATPRLARLCARTEQLPATALAQVAEGLGPTPFTAPRRPTPPEGSAL